MNENIKLGRFVEAIELCSQCHKDANTLRNLKCVQNSFSQSLSESYEAIENAMETTMNLSLKSCDMSKYDQVILGYRLLGKTSRISEFHLSFFTDNMHNTSQEYLSKFVAEKDPDPVKNAGKLEKLKKSPFKDLCSLLEGEIQFRQCLAGFYSCLYESMCNYQYIISWFEKSEKEYVMQFYDDDDEDDDDRCF
jgi:hypothetical protein